LRVAFDEFRFDSDSRELRRGQEAVRLSPKAFELLSLLLENRPRALSKSECHARVWPTSFVSEATLASVVKEIRSALKDEARAPRYLRTVHGFGYSFCGEASESPGPASLPERHDVVQRLVWGLREIDLHDGENLLGRSRESVVFVDSEDVSRRHAVIRVQGVTATLEDLGSKNGTRLGDRRIVSVEALQDGDIIAIGPAAMTFRVLWEGRSTKTQPPGPREP
jgi:DNA-binding winged helix-turn-helix (wHTH) protein